MVTVRVNDPNVRTVEELLLPLMLEFIGRLDSELFFGITTDAGVAPLPFTWIVES
jgi:hypothetical protein